ncbi:hypothetical protein D4764_15G0011130 [Takifugu flavidus]|uniref:Uncharacterized protein n=1 Tax=Takifugu flavidus TaxID=433684 RepID=A0A5C6P6G4_9TELE|nr:hypothetical protein D4764_15G0011130 [Takifugu flavidus]
MAQRGTQQLKAEQEPLESSMETWREEVQHLREALAEKEEQLSRAVMRTVTHVETLTQLNNTQAALKESNLKCASLEETLHSQQQEIEERHRRELMKQEEAVGEMREELEQKIQESQRLRQEEQEKTKEELQRLSEAILQLELQVSKKKKNKSFCRWISKKMKFWKS